MEPLDPADAQQEEEARRRGEATESRGAQACYQIMRAKPELIKRVWRSSPAEDAAGIDYFVEMTLPPGTSRPTIVVPMQFKTSLLYVLKWKQVHSALDKAGVLVFYFRPWMSLRKIRRLIYRALQRVQHNSEDGTLYDDVLKNLFKNVGKNFAWFVRKVEEERAKESMRRGWW